MNNLMFHEPKVCFDAIIYFILKYEHLKGSIFYFNKYFFIKYIRQLIKNIIDIIILHIMIMWAVIIKRILNNILFIYDN